MADENTLHISFTDDTPPDATPYPSGLGKRDDLRPNPALDEFMKMGNEGPVSRRVPVEPERPTRTRPEPAVPPDQMIAGMTGAVFNRLPADAMTKPLSEWLQKQDLTKALPSIDDRKNPMYVIAEIAAKLEKGLLTANEALDRARKAARAGGDEFTDRLRREGAIKPGQSTDQFFTDTLRKKIEGGETDLPTALPAKGQAGKGDWIGELLQKFGGPRVGAVKDIAGQFGKMGATTAGEAAGAGEAGAAAGAEGAAAVAGPIAIAVVAAKFAADEIAKGFRKAREDVESFGKQTRAVIDDKPLAVFTENVDRAAKGMEEIPIVGKIYAEQLRAAAAPVKEFAQTLEAVTARGKELAAYDPRLAQAKANQEVANILRDMREAREAGGQYAALIDKQTELEGTFRDMMLPIKDLIAKGLNDVLGPVNAILRDVGPAVGNIARGVSSLHDMAKDGIEVGTEILKRVPVLGVAVRKAEEHFDETKRERLAKDGREANAVLEMIRGQADKNFRIGNVLGEDPALRDKMGLQLPFGIQVPAGP